MNEVFLMLNLGLAAVNYKLYKETEGSMQLFATVVCSVGALLNIIAMIKH